MYDQNVINSNLKLDKIEAIAIEKMERCKAAFDRESGFIYQHGKRTAAIALKLRKIVQPDDAGKDDLLYVAGLFHDIGKGNEPHWETGAILARELLAECCNPAELEEIIQMIRLHNQRKSGHEYPTLVKIIQDADLLDHFGTLEIWLSFWHNAARDQGIPEMLQYWQSAKYQKYLKKMRKLINYEISEQIYDERVQYTGQFIRRFLNEMQGELTYLSF